MSIPRQIPYGIQAENGTTSKSRTQPASQIRVCFAGAALESEPSGAIPARRSAGPTVVSVEDELLDAEADTDLPIVGEADAATRGV